MILYKRTFIRLVAGMVMANLAGHALGAPKLVSSSPAPGAEVAPTKRVQLHFSEKMKSAGMTASLVATRMMMGSQMVDHNMAISDIKTGLDPNDAKTIVVTAASPLVRGTYKLAWKASSASGTALAGNIAFSIK